MNKLITKAIGIGIGAIGLLTLITKHPIIVAIILIGAIIYFIGDRLL